MSKSASTVILAFVFLNGIISIFIAIYLRTKYLGHVKVQRYLMRGIVSVVLGSISFLLLRSEVISIWAALLSLSVLLIFVEYLMLIRERQRSIKERVRDPAEAEKRDDRGWVKTRNKGARQYVLEHVAIYGAGGFLSTALLSIVVPESLPLYTWIVGGLFAAFCGGLAAWEKWKRWRH